MYNLAIGDRIYSSWSLRGWLMFKKFNIPVNVETARMYSVEFTDLLMQYGGGSTVPAMRIDGPETVLVWDTLAIAETLAEKFPEMWPITPAARGFARSITAEMHSGFGSLRDECTMNLRHVYEGFKPSNGVLRDLSRIDEIWTAARDQYGDGGPWLFGQYSIADAFYAPIATRILTYNLPVGSAAKSYIQTVISDPDFICWRTDGLAENYVQPGYDIDLPTTNWPDV